MLANIKSRPLQSAKSCLLAPRLTGWSVSLPYLQGKATDYVVGFNDLGGSDDFPTSVLAARLAAGGLIFEDASTAAAARAAAGQQQQPQRTLRQGGAQRTESDEDSDFD